MNSTYSDDGANYTVSTGVFYFVIVIMIVSISVNLFVIMFVSTPVCKLRGQPTVNKLVANLAATGAIAVLFGFFSSGAGVGLLSVEGAFCRTTSFMKRKWTKTKTNIVSKRYFLCTFLFDFFRYVQLRFCNKYCCYYSRANSFIK